MDMREQDREHIEEGANGQFHNPSSDNEEDDRSHPLIGDGASPGLLMETGNGSGRHDLHLASRREEESASRRFHAVDWLENLVGPLGMTSQPSEREFVSRLRNGLILCNAINKIQPGSVPKVVNYFHKEALSWDSKAVPTAYQHFENVRNFLVAIKELNMPAFEASDLETENIEAGSAGRVVDCILALQAHHEMRQLYGRSGYSKPIRSPLPPHPTRKNIFQSSNSAANETCRGLDLSVEDNKKLLQDAIAKLLIERMVDRKENIDHSFLSSLQNRKEDPVKVFRNIVTNCLEEQLPTNLLELNPVHMIMLREESDSIVLSESIQKINTAKCCRSCKRTNCCCHRLHLLKKQQNELLEIKASLAGAKSDFENLQCQFGNDMKQLESLVEGMSSAANGYQKVAKENRNLFNKVQDLKGNIRVYCRIRPLFDDQARNAVDSFGNDGSLVLVDPSKPPNGRKTFQFNRVLGPTASQDEVFKDIKPFMRSVMDGYNVCILAYGQTGSGKSYTMSAPSTGSSKDMGLEYLALNHLFDMLTQKTDLTDYDIFVKMIEIQDEQVRDLLAEICSLDAKLGTVSPYESEATSHSIKTITDAFRLIKLGEVKRSSGVTAMDNQGCRSHSVLTVFVHGKDLSGSKHCGRLHMVDLAGTRKLDTLTEANNYDKSLSCLEKVITALSQKSSYIPYKESVLTTLLQDALGGNAKTLMVAHVCPEADKLEETLDTLKFAQTVSAMDIGGLSASSDKQKQEVLNLKQQVEKLKKALLKKEAEGNLRNQRPTSPYEKPETSCGITPPPSRRRIEKPSPVKVTNVGEGNDKRIKDPRSPTQNLVRSSQRLIPQNRKIEKSPIQQRIGSSERTPPISQQRNFVEDHSSRKYVKSRQLSAPPPRSRRLSIANPTLTRPTTPNFKFPIRGGKAVAAVEETTPQQRSRRLKVENSTHLMGSEKDHHVRDENKKLNKSPPSAAESEVGKSSSTQGLSSMKELIHGEMLAENNLTQVSSSSHQDLETVVDCPILQPLEPRLFGNIEARTPSTTAKWKPHSSLERSASRKESHIRKSLKTIGKLINGTDKRHRKPADVISINKDGRNTTSMGKNETPTINNSLPLRRRSLTGVLSGTERRSSLGGKSTDAYVVNTRIIRTPPSSQSFGGTTRRWV